MLAEFCVLCGRTDGPIVEGECPDCFAQHHVLVGVPTHPTVILCPACRARRVGNHWERSGSSSLLGAEDLLPLLEPHPDVAIRRVDWRETGSNPLVRRMEGDVALRFRGIERSVAVKLEVRIEHRTCLDCSRRSGHFYTAQIQLRAPEEPRREPARALRARLAQVWDLARQETQNHWEQAVSFAEELPEGWDYFFTDTLAARGLARWMKNRFHAELKESASLWGRKDGRDVYRVTFCLRVPKGAPEAKSSPRTVRPRGPLRKSSRVQRQA